MPHGARQGVTRRPGSRAGTGLPPARVSAGMLPPAARLGGAAPDPGHTRVVRDPPSIGHDPTSAAGAELRQAVPETGPGGAAGSAPAMPSRAGTCGGARAAGFPHGARRRSRNARGSPARRMRRPPVRTISLRSRRDGSARMPESRRSGGAGGGGRMRMWRVRPHGGVRPDRAALRRVCPAPERLAGGAPRARVKGSGGGGRRG